MKNVGIQALYCTIMVGVFCALSVDARETFFPWQCSRYAQTNRGYQENKTYGLLRKSASQRKDWPDNYTKQRVSSFYNTPDNVGAKRRNSWN